jgi:hypothetical protein
MRAEKEFVSKLEEILSAEELVLPSTPAFGEYKPFLEHATAHPAKMNTKLIEFLAESLRLERVNKTLNVFLRSLQAGRRG